MKDQQSPEVQKLIASAAEAIERFTEDELEEYAEKLKNENEKPKV